MQKSSLHESIDNNQQQYTCITALITVQQQMFITPKQDSILNSQLNLRPMSDARLLCSAPLCWLSSYQNSTTATTYWQNYQTSWYKTDDNNQFKMHLVFQPKTLDHIMNNLQETKLSLHVSVSFSLSPPMHLTVHLRIIVFPTAANKMRRKTTWLTTTYTTIMHVCSVFSHKCTQQRLHSYNTSATASTETIYTIHIHMHILLQKLRI